VATAQTIDIHEFTNSRPFTRFQIMVLVFLVVDADGFDTAAIGFITPTIREQWKLNPSQLSYLFVAGVGGLMVGAFVFGPINRIGRKGRLAKGNAELVSVPAERIAARPHSI
jgi:AAHS family 4-hydroxybenzoate transporter-like MFS transporter